MTILGQRLPAASSRAMNSFQLCTRRWVREGVEAGEAVETAAIEAEDNVLVRGKLVG